MLRGACCGPLDGAPLAMYSATEMRWKAWRELHPETLIVSGALGFDRDYGSYPYGNYEILNNEVEFGGYFDRSPAEIRSGLAAAGLSSPAAHMDRNAVIADWPNTLDRATTIGRSDPGQGRPMRPQCRSTSGS
jgi:hypothetical protein